MRAELSRPHSVFREQSCGLENQIRNASCLGCCLGNDLPTWNSRTE
ncbi:MAG: hypothetical protein ACKERG_04495 [Candidatus Hodgkinia cicadicola]